MGFMVKNKNKQFKHWIIAILINSIDCDCNLVNVVVYLYICQIETCNVIPLKMCHKKMSH